MHATPPSRWLDHSPATDPGPFRAALAAIGPEPAAAIAAIQGLLIHGESAARYGLEPRPFDRTTLTVGERLATILARNPSPLDVARSPGERAMGTCRDYALLLCAAMRAHGTPARVRCGFARYFAGAGGAPWEDHWLCETWSDGRWRRADAQLDDVLRPLPGPALDPADVPADAYMTADEALDACLAGRVDPLDFGHGDARGRWFVRLNAERDTLALRDQITSDWDRWRERRVELEGVGGGVPS